MSYNVGEYIDLTYLNKKAVPARHKKSLQETASNLYQVGTRFTFYLTPEGFKAAIKIPVSYA